MPEEFIEKLVLDGKIKLNVQGIGVCPYCGIAVGRKHHINAYGNKDTNGWITYNAIIQSCIRLHALENKPIPNYRIGHSIEEDAAISEEFKRKFGGRWLPWF